MINASNELGGTFQYTVGTKTTSNVKASLRDKKTFGRKTVIIGDSITARGHYGVTLTGITAAAGVATGTATAHALYPGATVMMGNCDQEYFNGLKTVIARTASNTFTFACPADAIATATFSGSAGTAVANERMSDRNWLEMANATVGHPLNIVVNAGVSGQTSTQILARFYRDCLAYSPELVQLLCGINDIQGTTAGQEATVLATIKSNILQMVNMTLASGASMILCTCLPLSTTAATYTAARGQMVLALNKYIRELADYYDSRIIVFDAWAAVVDATTGDFKTNYSSDGIHPTAQATEAMATKLALILPSLRYPRTQWVGTAIDTYDTDSSNKQIDPNPLNIGTAGTKAVSPAADGSHTGTNTGNVPTGYTCTLTRTSTGNAVNSLVSRSDGFGNDHHIVFVSADANDAVDIVQTSSLHGRVAAGDVVVAECNLAITSITNISNISLAFEWGNGGTTYSQPAAIGSGASGQLTANSNFILRTPPLVIPADGVTSLKTRLKITGAGVGGATIDWGRHSMIIQQYPPSISQ